MSHLQIPRFSQLSCDKIESSLHTVLEGMQPDTSICLQLFSQAVCDEKSPDESFLQSPEVQEYFESLLFRKGNSKA